MASVAVLGTSVFTTTAGNKTITATPTANDLIVIIAAATGVTGPVGATAVSDNNSDGKGTYVKVGSTFTGFSTSGGLDVWVRQGKIGSATSTVFTATQGSSTGGGLVIYAITGISIIGLGAIRGAGGQSSGGAGATPAPILLARVGTTFSGTQAALTGNVVIGAVANGTNPAALTPPTSFTEGPTPDLGYATPTTGLETVFRNSGTTASTITWGGTSATAFASIAVEIDASVPIIEPEAPKLQAVNRKAYW